MDEFLISYRSNVSLRDCNIEAKLCIGREGEYGEYPSEPYLDYMKLDVEGFEEQFENSYIYIFRFRGRLCIHCSLWFI